MHSATANVSRFTFTIAQADESHDSLIDELRVYQFEYRESISSHFLLTLEFVSENHALKPQQLLQKSALLCLHGDQDKQYVHGIISEAACMEHGRRFARYSVNLVPMAWFLNYRRGCRIFQELSVPEIINTIFDEAGLMPDIHYQWQIERDYPKRSYCTQYNETEWQFIARLMAQEGIHFHYQHSVATHLLVLGDGKTAFDLIDACHEVPFHAATGLVQQLEHINHFVFKQQINHGKTCFRDYNFQTPSRSLATDHQGNYHPALEDYHYPGRYSNEHQGLRYARIRQEFYDCQQQTGSATSNVQRLRAGKLFHLTGHRYRDNNRQHLLTRISHFGHQPQSLEEDMPAANGEQVYYHNEFETIPGHIIFRPALIDHKPLIHGQQYAFVTGPEGEEIYVNEHGQIKVQFLWDRQGQQDERTTTWLRVSNEQAGRNWGQIMLPRIGQQILVEFEGGDPDRPLISGRCYNGDSLPPYTLPAHKTRSTIKSNSTPGGDGYNEIRFEDAKTREQIYIHSERDLDIRCKNDKREYVGHDRSLMVEQDHFEHIKGDNHQIIDNSLFHKVGSDLSRNITGAQHIHARQKYLVNAGHDIHIRSQSVMLDAGSELTFKAPGGFIKIDPSGVTINGIRVNFNSGGNAGSAQSPAPTSPTQAQQADNDKPGRSYQAATPDTPYQMAKLDDG